MARLPRRLAALAVALFLASCGGGGGGSSPAPAPTPTPAPTPAPAVDNTAALVVDNGPAAIAVGPSGYVDDDTVFVSVTVCAPGTTTCQTVDHVQVDTGSIGLRLYSSVLDPALLAALPGQTSPFGNPVGECYQFVDGYIFGGIRSADVMVGGETAPGLAFEVIGDPRVGATVPASCTSGGGSNINSVNALGSNGIYGVGVTVTDCGDACAAGGSGSAIYYDCPASGCATTIARAANTSVPYQQVPNPVAALPVDNNGVIISLPAVAANGAPTATGKMYFGIGTKTDNTLGAATILATTTSASPSGAGFVTATYNGKTLTKSFLDSGSNGYFFVDGSIPTCPDNGYVGYYCPATVLSLSAQFLAANGGSVAAPFQIGNAESLFALNNAALPALGGNPELFGNLAPYPNSFDFGLPFFFGRNVYVAFEGRTVGATPGPFFAY